MSAPKPQVKSAAQYSTTTAVQHAYRMAIDRAAVFRLPEPPTTACRSPERAADVEIEPE
jgi:hypothetical protein